MFWHTFQGLCSVLVCAGHPPFSSSAQGSLLMLWLFPGQPRLFTSYYKLLCRCCKYLLQKIISNSNKCRKQILNFVWNTWKCWWNKTYGVTCVCTIYLNFEIYFLGFPWKIAFGVISGNYLIYLILVKRTLIKNT